jgi:hypothetical protein
MARHAGRCWRWLPLVCWLAGLAAALGPAVGRALTLTADSPEVKRAIERGIGFLENPASQENRIGGLALVALVELKNGADAQHAKVVAAVDKIRAAVRAADNDPDKIKVSDTPSTEIYNLGLAIILLCELDPSRNSSEIEVLLKSLLAKQKPHGGWGYPERQTGDTSMTQYAVLACWEAKQAGFVVRKETIEGVTHWIIKTQDPSGGFGYQGNVASGSSLVAQSDVKNSMTAAGAGIVYICADLLGMNEEMKKKQQQGDLPAALKEVGQQEARRAARTQIDSRRLHETEVRANLWLRANYKIDPPGFTHYYLYALERYSSFRELAEGRIESEQKWYSDGAHFLIKSQAADGSWSSQGEKVPNTAFGCLFLLRSTKKSIEKARSYGSGWMVGGKGLPKDTESVKVRQGNVVAAPSLAAADQLLAAVDNPEEAGLAEKMESLAALSAAETQVLLSTHAQKLRRLAEGATPEARRAAVSLLARGDDLDNVPTLIFAMRDSDAAVVREAWDALRRISRRLDLPPAPASPGEEQRKQAIETFKAWYLAIRPDADLEE